MNPARSRRVTQGLFLSLWSIASQLFAFAAPSQGQPSYVITGMVVSERDGTPVPRCHVTASRSGDAPTQRASRQRFQAADDTPSADTDTSGHFRISLPSGGNWQISGSARNFRQQIYSHHENFFSAVVLTPAAPTVDILFHLEPDGSISGFVLDEAGEGVRNARVNLLAAEPVNPDAPTVLGVRRTNTTTDDRGHYELSGIASGNYLVEVVAEPWYAASSGGRRLPSDSPSPGSELDVVYPETWFPGVTDRHLAEVLTLRGGESLQANFNLAPSPSVHLHVSLPPPAADEADHFQSPPSIVRLSPDGTSNPFNAAVRSDTGGQFDIGGLSPGLYRLGGSRNTDTDTASFIRVGGGAQHDLDLSAAIPAGEVLFRMQSDEPSDRVQVVLTDVDTGTRFSSGSGTGFQRRRNADLDSAKPGERTLQVPPGRYQVTLVGDPEVYLGGISIKGRSVPGRILSLESGGTTVDLRVSRGRASIRGVVTLAQRPVSEAMVMLVPVTFGQSGSITILRRDQSNTDGSFFLTDIIPGDYILLAIDHGWTVNWKDPSTLQRYLLGGVPTSLQSRGTLKQNLTAQTP